MKYLSIFFRGYFFVFWLFCWVLPGCQTSPEESNTNPSNDSNQPKVTAPKAGVGLLAFRTFDNQSKKLQVFEDIKLTKKILELDASIDAIGKEQLIKPRFFSETDSVCYFTCTGWDDKVYTVITNEDNQQEMYIPIDTLQYRFIGWKDILVGIGEIKRKKDTKNPVLVEAKQSADKADWDTLNTDSFFVEESYKKWLKVKDTESSNSGWIKWVDFDKLLVELEIDKLKNLEKITLPPDPSAKMYKLVKEAGKSK